MFINMSNHPSINWGAKQRETAEQYGRIWDIPFPRITTSASSEEIDELVREKTNAVQKVIANSKDSADAVMVEGEFVFTYRMVCSLKKIGILTLAAVTQRVVKEEMQADGTIEKLSKFQFEGFRKY